MTLNELIKTAAPNNAPVQTAKKPAPDTQPTQAQKVQPQSVQQPQQKKYTAKDLPKTSLEPLYKRYAQQENSESLMDWSPAAFAGFERDVQRLGEQNARQAEESYYQQGLNEILQRSPWVAQQMGSMPGATPQELYDQAVRMEHYGATQQGVPGAMAYQQQQEAARQAEAARQQQMQAQADALNRQQSAFWNQHHQVQAATERARNQAIQNQMAQQMQAYSNWYKSPEQEMIRADAQYKNSPEYANYDLHQNIIGNYENMNNEINAMLDYVYGKYPNMTPEQRAQMDDLGFRRWGQTYTDRRNEFIAKQNAQAQENYRLSTVAYNAFQKDAQEAMRNTDVRNGFDMAAFEAQWEKEHGLPPGSVQRVRQEASVAFTPIPLYTPQTQQAVAQREFSGDNIAAAEAKAKAEAQKYDEINKPAPSTQQTVTAQTTGTQPAGTAVPATGTQVASTQTSGKPVNTGSGRPVEQLPADLAGEGSNPNPNPNLGAGGSPSDLGLMAWAQEHPNMAAGIAALLTGALTLGLSGGGGDKKKDSSLGLVLAMLLSTGAFFGTRSLLTPEQVAQNSSKVIDSTKSGT